MMKQIALSILGILLLVSAVTASGVSSPYWTGTNPRALTAYPGQIVDVRMTLQNMVGSEDLKFKASIINGTSIAKIIDASDIYDVPAGRDDVPVMIRVTVPLDAQIGARYNVGASFSTIGVTSSGAFTFGSAFDKYFDVVVQQRPAPAEEQAEEPTPNSGLIIVISLVLLAILIIGVLTLQRKKRK